MIRLRLLAIIAAVSILCSCSLITGNPAGTTAESTAEPTTPAAGISVPDVSPGEILDYFNEVAIGSEYGESAEVVCKWTKNITYAVKGPATEEDIALIEQLCERLNGIEGFPGIRKALIEDKADLTVSFVPISELTEMFTSADESCAGMAEYSWNSETGEIFSARVGIDETIVEERRSTICEEFLQALGPACDSYSYINSVFYEGTSYVSAPSALDWAIMEILYAPTMEVGCRREQAAVTAAALVRWRAAEES